MGLPGQPGPTGPPGLKGAMGEMGLPGQFLCSYFTSFRLELFISVIQKWARFCATHGNSFKWECTGENSNTKYIAHNFKVFAKVEAG